MSIEKALADLTVALNENTAALKSAGTGKAVTGTGKGAAAGSGTGTGTAAANSPKHTRAEMTAALQEVKEKNGAPAAKQIIADTGGAAKMADIADDKIDAVYDAAKKALEGGGDGL